MADLWYLNVPVPEYYSQKLYLQIQKNTLLSQDWLLPAISHTAEADIETSDL